MGKQNYLHLSNRLKGLYVNKLDESMPPWRISPTTFPLSPLLEESIKELGVQLVQFYQAANKLYLQSVKGHMPAFIAAYIEQGKPESIIKLMRQNCYKNSLPNVIRPDLILSNNGFIITELDSVPGGMGYAAEMAAAYSDLGFDVFGGKDGMLTAFSRIFKNTQGDKEVVLAIVVSDEAKDYEPELRAFVKLLNTGGYLKAYVCHPRDICYTEEQIYILYDEKQIAIDAIYRFFELFDLSNIPKHELILYAASHKKTFLTPPPKANLEEKMLFAFFWHANLREFWERELGLATFNALQHVFPKTWILDPEHLPAQAAISGLEIHRRPVFNWEDIGQKCLRKERNFVIKPSGFSELAWGAHGVSIGNTLSREHWDELMTHALNSFKNAPYVLQEFHNGKHFDCTYYHPDTQVITDLEGRVRLCPYYFYSAEEVILGGVMATICPIETDIIHGTPEAIITVCSSQ